MRYLIEHTTLGTPALIQSEGSFSLLKVNSTLSILPGLHGFTNNGNNIPITSSLNTALISRVSAVVVSEAEGLGINHAFALVLDLSREQRWRRVEENFEEDPFLTGEMGARIRCGAPVWKV